MRMDAGKNKDQVPTIIQAKVERSLFSVAIGQINIHVSVSRRADRRRRVLDRFPGECRRALLRVTGSELSVHEVWLATEAGCLAAGKHGGLTIRNRLVCYLTLAVFCPLLAWFSGVHLVPAWLEAAPQHHGQLLFISAMVLGMSWTLYLRFYLPQHLAARAVAAAMGRGEGA